MPTRFLYCQAYTDCIELRQIILHRAETIVLYRFKICNSYPRLLIPELKT